MLSSLWEWGTWWRKGKDFLVQERSNHIASDQPDGDDAQDGDDDDDDALDGDDDDGRGDQIDADDGGGEDDNECVSHSWISIESIDIQSYQECRWWERWSYNNSDDHIDNAEGDQIDKMDDNHTDNNNDHINILKGEQVDDQVLLIIIKQIDKSEFLSVKW